MAHLSVGGGFDEAFGELAASNGFAPDLGGAMDPLSMLGAPSITGGAAAPSSAEASGGTASSGTGAFVVGDGNRTGAGLAGGDLLWLAALVGLAFVVARALKR